MLLRFYHFENFGIFFMLCRLCINITVTSCPFFLWLSWTFWTLGTFYDERLPLFCFQDIKSTVKKKLLVINTFLINGLRGLVADFYFATQHITIYLTSKYRWLADSPMTNCTFTNTVGNAFCAIAKQYMMHFNAS